MTVKFFVDYMREDPALAAWVAEKTRCCRSGECRSVAISGDLFQEE